MVVLLKNIIIPRKFIKSTPSESKMDTVRVNYFSGVNIENDIVVDENMKLIDGYIRYLVLKENNIVLADVSVKEKNDISYRNIPTTYIFGKHNQDGKTYVWRIVKSTKNLAYLNVGNVAEVDTRYGRKRVIIDDIKVLDKCPVEYPVKKVLRCYIK